MIYIARHGQTDWNAAKKLMGSTDIPLNENGREQANTLAELVKDKKIESIFSSDLLRAKETAEIIGKSNGLSVVLDKRLRELNYGELEGTNLKTIPQELWDRLHRQPETLKAENFESLYLRVKDFFDELSCKKINNSLIVTHGGASRMMMYYAQNREKLDRDDYINNYLKTKIDNGALFELEL